MTEQTPAQHVKPKSVTTWQIKLLIAVNILFLTIIAAGLCMVLPPIVSGVQHYLDAP